MNRQFTGKEMQLTLKQMTTCIVWRRWLSYITGGNEKCGGIWQLPNAVYIHLRNPRKCNPKSGKNIQNTYSL